MFFSPMVGLKLYPGNKELQLRLKEARVAVLNDLLIESDEEEEDIRNNCLTVKTTREDNTNKGIGKNSRKMESTNESDALRSSQIVQHTPTYATAGINDVLANDNMGSGIQERVKGIQSAIFKDKLDRILEHIDVRKLARMTVIYISVELLNLRHVTIGIGFCFLGILAQAVMHRQKLMVISMLIIFFYRSQFKERILQYAQVWVQTSKDKLGAFVWIPRVVFMIPIFMNVIGQLKFMLFLQQDFRLGGIVLIFTMVLAVNSLRADAGQQAKLWGKGRRLKVVAYFIAIVYWVIWRGQWADSIRLLGPAFIDAGGIVLGCVTSNELQMVCRCALIKLYNDVANDVQSDVDLDAWFVLGLSSWLIEYWQQPTDFSLVMLLKMLTECFDAMEKAAVRTFSPELCHLRNQIKNLEITDELHLLVVYLKQSIEGISPTQLFGMAALFAKSFPSFIVFGLLVVFYGVIPLSLLSFIVSESQDANILYGRYKTGELQEMDGFELMLLDSPLFIVWKNLKSCIYCLEGSVTFTKAVATGANMVSAAARISRFAFRVKHEGVFANAHDIPDNIANLYLVTKDSSLIIDGLRYLRESTQIQDLKASIAKWWSGERPNKKNM